MKIDTENALIFVKGALPGKKGTVVTLTDAVKRVSAKILPYPAGFKDVFEENQKPVEAAVKAEEVGSNEQDK